MKLGGSLTIVREIPRSEKTYTNYQDAAASIHMTFEEHSEVQPVNGEIFKAIERENPLNTILILHVQKI